MSEQEKLKILVIEDEPDLRTTLKLRLVSQGFDVTLAGDGLQAFELMNEFVPDCIVLDLMMPVMDGFGFLKRIRTINHMAKVPVIILTAAQGIRNRAKGEVYQADAYIRKPYEPERLERAINRLCSEHASKQTSP